MVEHKGFLVDADCGVVYRPSGVPISKICSGGYVQVFIKGKYVAMAHRFIWESVHGAIPESMEINHKNGIKHDNRIVNLELVTPSENCIHAYKANLKSAEGENNGRAKLNERQVREIRASSEPATKIAGRFSVSARTVCDVKNRKRWRHVP